MSNKTLEDLATELKQAKERIVELKNVTGKLTEELARERKHSRTIRAEDYEEGYKDGQTSANSKYLGEL
jgi:hypothetical protein